MIKKLDYVLKEPKHHNYFDFNWKKFISISNDVRISKRLNHFLANKKVILVGPSPYLVGQKKGEYINSFDIVVRFNKGWKIENDLTIDYGKRTDILWHCMKTNSCGNFEIEKKIKYGVKWIISQFPRNLDYFDQDITDFELLNNDRIKFEVFSDLLYFINIQNAIGTRPNIGVTAILDLLNYDIKSLNVIGFSFHSDGYYFKDNRKLTSVYHKIKPQKLLLKILNDNVDKLTFDKEIVDQLDNENYISLQNNYAKKPDDIIIIENKLINSIIKFNKLIRKWKNLLIVNFFKTIKSNL